MGRENKEKERGSKKEKEYVLYDYIEDIIIEVER